MTKKEAESPTGRRLIHKLLSMCHDGSLEIHEVEELHMFLRRAPEAMAAIPFLRAITRQAVADGSIDAKEAYRLKAAFERVVPREVRGVISTHLASIGLPVLDEDDSAPAWIRHEATARQIEYIVALGGGRHPGAD